MAMDVLSLLKYRGPIQIPTMAALPVDIAFPALVSVDGVIYENRFAGEEWRWIPFSGMDLDAINEHLAGRYGDLHEDDVNKLKALPNITQEQLDVLLTLTTEDIEKLKNIEALITSIATSLIPTEVYPGYDVYDAGHLYGPSPVIHAAQTEPDVVDLNP